MSTNIMTYDSTIDGCFRKYSSCDLLICVKNIVKKPSSSTINEGFFASKLKTENTYKFIRNYQVGIFRSYE